MKENKNENSIEKYAKADKLMRLGQRTVFMGFIVSLFGIIAYCVASFNPQLNEKVGGVLYDNAGWLTLPSLGTTAIGTLLWLIGSFIHLKGAMDNDPKKPL